jgi:hypothetical protein
MSPTSSFQDVLQQLYSVPPGQFASSRKEAATRLRSLGAVEDARKVAALRKPSSTLWAINQLARRAPDELKQFLQAGAEVAGAESEALSGRGGAHYLEAGHELRRKTARLTESAGRLLEAAGISATKVVLRRISAALLAVATGKPQDREALLSGILTEEPVPETWLESVPASPPVVSAPPKRDEPPSRDVERKKLEQRLQAATARERELVKRTQAVEANAGKRSTELEQARQRVEQLAKELERAQSAAASSERAAAAAEAEVVELEQQLGAIRSEVRDLEQRLRR